MNAGNFSSSPNDVPQLSLSLWSIRHRMILRPADTLSLIEDWGISTVEIAGFFEFEAGSLQEELTNHHITVCSVVAPPFRTGREFSFYCKWIDKYLPIFGASTIVLQSLPENFRSDETNSYKKTCEAIVDLIFEIAREMHKSSVRVSYHCFPYDFRLVDGQSFVSQLFVRSDVPDNFGLQLDTYWLRVGGIALQPTILFRFILSTSMNEMHKVEIAC